MLTIGGKQRFGRNSVAPSGTLAMRSRASFKSVAEALAHAPFDIGVAHDFEAEAVGDAFDGHVVVGRADTAVR